MVRLAKSPAGEQTIGPSQDVLFAQLSQLVARLRQNILHPTPERERRLRTSEYERARVEANIEYAMSLLNSLDQDASRIKTSQSRAERLDALNAVRDMLETLQDSIEDLRHLSLDGGAEDSEEEDLLGDIVATPSESVPYISEESRQEDTEDEETVPASHPPQPVPVPSLSPPPVQPRPDISPPEPAIDTLDSTHATQSLRSRSSAPSQPSTSADVSHSTGRAALFASRRDPAAAQTSTATAEAILDQQRAEQDSLSGSMLQMASALKASSQRFSTSLEADKDVVSRAGEGIDKTERSMDAARGRMGALRKMTEGKGWWGRVMLYAWVYGLMVSLLLLVFAMPKLRF